MANEIEGRIIEHAARKFMQFGVRGVTMDDLSKELGISKKTLYQSFQNKADLVHAVSKQHFEQEVAISEAISQSAIDAVDEFVKVAKWSFEMFRQMSANLIVEIQKYYPRAWGLFLGFRTDYVLGKLQDNLRWGMKEGLYRSDLNVEILARLRLSQIDSSIREEYFPIREFRPVEVQEQMFEMYMRGIVTDAGRTLLDTYLSQPFTQVQTTSSS